MRLRESNAKVCEENLAHRPATKRTAASATSTSTTDHSDFTRRHDDIDDNTDSDSDDSGDDNDNGKLQVPSQCTSRRFLIHSLWYTALGLFLLLHSIQVLLRILHPCHRSFPLSPCRCRLPSISSSAPFPFRHSQPQPHRCTAIWALAGRLPLSRPRAPPSVHSLEACRHRFAARPRSPAHALPLPPRSG